MAMPLGSMSQLGRASVQPSGSCRLCSEYQRALCSGFFSAQASNVFCQAAFFSMPSPTVPRVSAGQLLVDLEGLLQVDPRIFLVAATSSAPSAEPSIVRCSAWSAHREADHGADLDERGPVGDLLGLVDRGQDAFDVLATLDHLGVPTVGGVPGRGVLGESDVDVVLDRDLVGVVEDDQVAKTLPAGDRGRLGGDALLLQSQFVPQPAPEPLQTAATAPAPAPTVDEKSYAEFQASAGSSRPRTLRTRQLARRPNDPVRRFLPKHSECRSPIPTRVSRVRRTNRPVNS